MLKIPKNQTSLENLW